MCDKSHQHQMGERAARSCLPAPTASAGTGYWERPEHMRKQLLAQFVRLGTSKVCVTNLQHSLYATARRCCSPRSDRGFYNRACVGRVAPQTHVGYDWMVHRHLPSPDFHRLDWQPYGLRAKTPGAKGDG